MGAALYQSFGPDALPLPRSVVRVSGVTLEPTLGSDAFEVTVDDVGGVSLVLIDLNGSVSDLASTAADLLEAVRPALGERRSMSDVVSLAKQALGTHLGANAAVGIVRFLPHQDRVEVLNAGLPPICCVRPDGTMLQCPPRSGPVGLLREEVHPYELVPLGWSDCWALVSDGASGGSLSGSAVERLIRALDLPAEGSKLAELGPEELAGRLANILDQLGASPEEDATFILAAPNRAGRGPSGFRR
jgi:hypothetical protein